MSQQIRISAGGLTRTFTAPGPVVLGRSSVDAAVVIGHRAVSGRHAELNHDGRRWLLTDLGSANGTWINGLAITGSTPIDAAATARLGKADDGADVVLEPLAGASKQEVPTEVAATPNSQQPAVITAETVIGASGPIPRIGPAVVVTLGSRSVTLAALPGRTYRIGRDPSSDVVSEDPIVSREHLHLAWNATTWEITDTSGRGTFAADGRPLPRHVATPLSAATTLRLGDPGSGPPLTLVPAADPDPRAGSPGTGSHGSPGQVLSELHRITHDLLTVGRDPSNSVVLDDLLVSRHHAELRFDGYAWWLSDLGSANGTYVDGRRIAREPVTPQNLIGIGHQTFRLRANTLEEYRDTGAVTFEARDLVVLIGDRRLLDEVSFVLDPNSMLVIIGPSGSGKSTLLRALTGAAPATTGQVGYGGRDLYSNYDEIRHRIGFVPQDDILHPQLRVREALDFAGRLRFPQDVDSAQRAHRVGEVLTELGLEQQAEQRISTLSGGQRKRTSTAMELLTRPSLLFLDEPTSGLDINRDREVMQRLRDLADAGRTVVVVSHNVAYLNLADRILILATGGQVAYYGPAGQMLDYFGAPDYADMYAALEQPRSDWRERFEKSPHTVPSNSRSPFLGKSNAPADVTPIRQQTAVSQFATLCRRYLAVIAADRQFVALMLAMPVVLALFAHAVPGKAGLSIVRSGLPPTASPGQLLLVLILGGCLVGSAASVREIVKERPIFQRERAIGLSWQAYLASKATVLAVLVGVQAILLTLLGVLGRPAPDEGVITSAGMLELILILILVTIASMALGLILSAVVTNADRAMPLLVLVIMAQLLMSGGLFPVRGRPFLEQLSWLAPARWAYAAGACLIDVGRIPNLTHDPLWEHDTGTFFGDLAVLVLLTAAYLAITAVLLRRIGRITALRGHGT